MKEVLTKKQFNWLKEASQKWEVEGLIQNDQRILIEERYVQRQQMTGLQLLLIIGGLLLALGLLTMVTTSWVSSAVWIKGLVLAMTVAGFIGIGSLLEKSLPKTAMGFYSVGLLVYSLGLLMLNEISGARVNHFSLYPIWLLGIGAFLWAKESPAIIGLSSILSGVLLTVEMINGNPLEGFQVIGYILSVLFPVAIILWNNGKNRVTWLGNLNGILIYISVLSLVQTLDMDSLVGLMLCFGLGFLWTFASKYMPSLVLSRWVGLHAIGVFGLLLSFEELWVGKFYNLNLGALMMLILAGIFFLWNLRNEVWLSGVWLILFITRLYFDTLFEVLPRGLFFILGGLILLVAGFLLEKFRKGKGGEQHEA